MTTQSSLPQLSPQSSPELSPPIIPAERFRHRRRLPRLQEFGLIVVIALIGLALSRLAAPVGDENGFLRPDNLIPSVFTTMSWIAVMSVGMTIVIISGGIDISVGSIMGLAALGCAAALQKFPEDASAWKVVPIGILVPIGIGAICGLVNGAIVVGLRMHPFIVTLGTMSIFRGIALVNVREGSLPSTDRNLPFAFTDHFISYTQRIAPSFSKEPIARLWNHWVKHPTTLEPVPMVLMFLVMLLGWLYLRWMIWGRETYAVGGSEEAARFSGISVGWVKMRAYLISGICAGIGGMISCGFYKSAATNTALGYELIVVAAAVVGGASLSGGRGTALGAILGTLVIQLIDNSTSILSEINLHFVRLTVSKEYTQIIVGVAIVLAVAVDRLSEVVQSWFARRRK